MSTILELCEKYENNKKQMDFFDVNCWWDPSHYTTFERFDDFDQLYATFKKQCINKAVITAAECILYDAKSGNKTMCDLIAQRDNLYGAMVLTTDHMITGEDVKAYIDNLVEHKAVIARVFPRTNKHSMSSWGMKDILDILSDRHIPMMIWHAETSWDTIDAICTQYPDLPVIVEGNDVKLLYHNRHYIPIFKKHKNMYLEIHNVVLFNEVDFFAAIDAERLLFGSYYPYNTPDAAMSQVVMGEFDDRQKQQIAHGNLERIISDIR